MRMRGNRHWRISLFMAALLWICAGAAPAWCGYHQIKKVNLGGEGFWDYLNVDGPNRHLFISRGTHVMVVDADKYTVVGDIPGTQGVHGIAIASDAGKGYTSNGGTNTATIFDLTTLKVLGTVPTGEGPDAIIYDPASHRVFTMNGHGQSATAIDAATGHVAGSIPLGGRPEFATADGQGHIYVNLEDKSQVVQLDSNALKVLNTWPLAPGDSPSGMAIDPQHRRTFSGCHNKMMVIMDADTGKVVATAPIGQGVDANAFDTTTDTAFSSNGDGTLTVVHEDSPDKFTVVENVTTQRGARTMALDPNTRNVFLVTAEFEPMPAPTPGQPRQRPKMVPGSFTLLVYAP